MQREEHGHWQRHPRVQGRWLHARVLGHRELHAECVQLGLQGEVQGRWHLQLPQRLLITRGASDPAAGSRGTTGAGSAGRASSRAGADRRASRGGSGSRDVVEGADQRDVRQAEARTAHVAIPRAFAGPAESPRDLPFLMRDGRLRTVLRRAPEAPSCGSPPRSIRPSARACQSSTCHRLPRRRGSTGAGSPPIEPLEDDRGIEQHRPVVVENRHLAQGVQPRDRAPRARSDWPARIRGQELRPEARGFCGRRARSARRRASWQKA